MSSHSWFGKHREEMLAALAVAGAAFTGGSSLLGLAGAGAEAGVGAGVTAAEAAGAGAGVSETVGAAQAAEAAAAAGGAGAAGGAASAAEAAGAGAGASESVQAAQLAQASAADQAPSAAANASSLGDGPLQHGQLDRLPGGGLHEMNNIPPRLGLLGKAGDFADDFSKFTNVVKASGLTDAPPRPQFAPMPHGAQVQALPAAPTLADMYGQPYIDDETKRRIARLRQMGMMG